MNNVRQETNTYFILYKGALSGRHVKVTDGDCRKSLQKLQICHYTTVNISYIKSHLHVAYHQEQFSDPCLCQCD